jgi:hypothetical protein
VRRRWLRVWSGRVSALHLARLPLLQEFGLLPMLVLDGSLHACVGILLRKVSVITFLHLPQRIALLLVAHLHRCLLPLGVELCSRSRLGRGWYGLRFGQIPGMHRHRPARTSRTGV